MKDGQTPLHKAAEGDSEKVAALLISLGADIHALDKVGLPNTTHFTSKVLLGVFDWCMHSLFSPLHQHVRVTQLWMVVKFLSAHAFNET